jgi:hypothetical protein
MIIMIITSNYRAGLPSSALLMDVQRVLVGLEMIDCGAIKAPY